MLPPLVVSESALESADITSNELLTPVQNHLWRVRPLKKKARTVDTLPLGKYWRREWVIRTEVVPVCDVLTDTDNQLSRICLLQVNLAQQNIGRRAA